MAILTVQGKGKRVEIVYNGRRAGVLTERKGNAVFVPDSEARGLGLQFVEMLADAMRHHGV